MEIAYHKQFPDNPWLTEASNNILASYLKKSDVGLEFGSGRSTLWFAQRVKALTSVEHNNEWFEKISSLLNRNGISNVTYIHAAKDVSDEFGDESAYVQVISRFENESLDFVLVDGVYRDYCSRKVIDKIRPGGLIILDNANWYLPWPSKSPDSRTGKLGPNGPIWHQVWDKLREWRIIWTSSGVTDTALFFKPCNK